MTDEPASRPAEPPADDLPEQMRVRRDKRERMLERGIEPYPLNVARTHSIAEIVASYDAAALGPDHRTGVQVAVTGRVIFLRNTGKLCFARLREGDGSEIQAMFSLADLGEESLADFKALVDIGDYLSRRGRGHHQPSRRVVDSGRRAG